VVVVEKVVEFIDDDAVIGFEAFNEVVAAFEFDPFNEVVE
jgi:hypothetical protein